MKLPRFSKLLIQGPIPALLVTALAFPPDIFSQATEPEHIVTPQALQQQLESSSAARQREIHTLTGFLSSPTADRALRDAHINPEQVKTAIPTLSDQELASLATRAQDAQQKFSAGILGTTTLLLIIVIVAIIIIVAAVH